MRPPEPIIDYKRSYFKTILGLILVFILVLSKAQAATYYVRTDGNNGNPGTSNTTGGAWRSIDWAADHVRAGDVVRVQPGTYEERVTPGVNGTSVSNTVTFMADGAVTVCGFDFTGNNFIRVIGFSMDSDAGSCSLQSGVVLICGTVSYLEFWNNTIRNGLGNGIRCGYGCSGVINNSLIIGNTFANFGIGNGSGMAVGTWGDNNFIAYNEVYNSHPDGFLIMGSHNRWIGNYTHDFSEASGGHSDVFQTGSNNRGWSNSLIEGHFQVGVGNAGDEHTAQISHGQPGNCTGACGPMTENIFRRNVWHNVSQATVGINQTSVGPVSFTRYYNNTTAGASRNSPTTRYGVCWYGPMTSDGFILNNLEYQSWGDSATSNLEVFYVTGGLTSDYNLAYDPDGPVSFASMWTMQAHEQSNVNPRFVNFATDDFTLGAGSGAIGKAGPLTTVSGSGTGTTFNVATPGGGFFRGDNTNLSQYGGNLIVGDTITVGNDVVTIASVAGDAITVTSPFTWANGEPVYYGSTTTPDIGAYPYKAGGYTLSATYSQSGGVVTVTPSDAGLVRFVVCYEDGIPTTVDHTSPYACPVGGGALEVRVYPLYASKTLYVAATPGVSPPPDTYTVKPDGSGHFTTIQACVNAAQAGQTCEVYDGTYNERVSSVRGGTSNSARISIAAATGQRPTVRGFSITHPYLTISGFTIHTGSTSSIGVDVNSAIGVTVENNSITAERNTCVRFNPASGSRSHHAIIRNNVITRCGWYYLLESNGTAWGIASYGDNTLIEGNDISHTTDDAINWGGNHSVIRNNVLHDMDADETGVQSPAHMDGIHNGPTEIIESLIEGNVFRNALDPTGNSHFTWLESGSYGAQRNIIMRYNYTHNVQDLAAPGICVPCTNQSRYYLFSNTISAGGPSSSDLSCMMMPANSPYSRAKNNLCYNTISTLNRWPIYTGGSGTQESNGNLPYADGYTGEWMGPISMEATYNTLKNRNPLLANYPSNGTLQATSPAIDAGAALTTVATSDGGSGTTLILQDAGYFQPGWAGTNADWIAVGSAANTGQILAIDYLTHTLTLANSISRNDGDSVWLYRKSDGMRVLYGSAPDVGAYEYTTSTPPPDTTPPSVPTGLAAVAVSSTAINLSWTASTDAVGVAGYGIYRNGVWISSVTSGTSYISTGLVSSTSYSYRVTAYDAAGNVSALSVAASATTQAPSSPPPPSGLSRPTLNLPDYLPVNAEVRAGYGGSVAPAYFSWTFTSMVGPASRVSSPASQVSSPESRVSSPASQVSSPGSRVPSPAPTAVDVGRETPDARHGTLSAGHAPSASFTTASTVASLAAQNLDLGTYLVTVTAHDASGSASSPASAQVTLVSANLDQVRVYPNPWRSDRHSTRSVTFDQLTVDTEIKIFTVSGHHVKTLPTSSSSITWDLTNESGDRVASGIYVYHLKAEGGAKKTGKVVVIK